MAEKINQIISEGIDQSKILIGDKWRDRSGSFITVTGCVFNRVSFTRDGYEHPCILPEARFMREFVCVERKQDPQKYTEWAANNKPLEKIQRLLAMIKENSGGSR